MNGSLTHHNEHFAHHLPIVDSLSPLQQQFEQHQQPYYFQKHEQFMMNQQNQQMFHIAHQQYFNQPEQHTTLVDDQNSDFYISPYNPNVVSTAPTIYSDDTFIEERTITAATHNEMLLKRDAGRKVRRWGIVISLAMILLIVVNVWDVCFVIYQMMYYNARSDRFMYGLQMITALFGIFVGIIGIASVFAKRGRLRRNFSIAHISSLLCLTILMLGCTIGQNFMSKSATKGELGRKPSIISLSISACCLFSCCAGCFACAGARYRTILHEDTLYAQFT